MTSSLFSSLLGRLSGRRPAATLNLNDPRWGRGHEDRPDESNANPPPEGAEGGQPQEPQRPQPPELPRPHSSGGGQQPPDLDELWNDFSRKLGGLFGGSPPPGRRGRSSPSSPVSPGSAGAGLALLAGAAALVWLGTGFFIVQEGQNAVITQFGRYHSTVMDAGLHWRLPWPIQRQETVNVTQIRSVDVGGDIIIPATGLRTSAMLTSDENIVEVKFAVQYRLSDARAYLFESKLPDDALRQASESAVREVLGNMKMDAALSEERDQIAPRVRELTQKILDRYRIGIEVIAVNMQQGGAQPPEQVKAAFDDVNKANQERERAKNLAQAYANDVVPRAKGAAARLTQEAEGYKARITAQAEGDAQRFAAVLAQYQKAPQVTRERMYLDAMQDIYARARKVLVDSRAGGNLLYLPLDKLMQQTGAPGEADSAAANQAANQAASPANAQTAQPAQAPAASATFDTRARDNARSRDYR